MGDDLSGSLVPLTDNELDDVRAAPSLPAAAGFEMLLLPLGSTQRLVAEVQRWREWSRRLGYHPPAPARIIIPCPVCGKDYRRVTAVPTPFEEGHEGQGSHVVDYIHEDGTRCRKVEDSPPQSPLSED